MLTKLGLPMMVLAGAMAFAAPQHADARVRVGVGIGIGAPVYAAPYAYSAAPYAYPAAPYVNPYANGYVAPYYAAPYVAPAPVYVGPNWGYGHYDRYRGYVGRGEGFRGGYRGGRR